MSVSTCKGSATFPRRTDQATDRERGKHTAKETTSHWDCTRALVGHRLPTTLLCPRIQNVPVLKEGGAAGWDWPYYS